MGQAMHFNKDFLKKDLVLVKDLSCTESENIEGSKCNVVLVLFCKNLNI